MDIILALISHHILEVTTAEYNIKMLASQLENADEKHLSEQVTKEDVPITGNLAAMVS